MKKCSIFMTVLTFFSSNLLIADEISGGSRVNMQTGELIIPCVNVDNPGSEFDGRYFDVTLVQIEEQTEHSYELISAKEEDSEVCQEQIKASLIADHDTADVNGNLGSTDNLIAVGASVWPGLIGIDYQPNHYPVSHVFNNHDVFYTGMNGANMPVTNIYQELVQLKAAGFTAVRSYQTQPYSWIDIINQANALGLSVIYEAAIPQSGDQTSISSALKVLDSVIDAVGVNTFKNTVILVFAGHENYSNSNINYLTSAIRQLQVALAGKGLSTIPVGTALVSGDLVTPGSPSDMQRLISAASQNAPLGFDPYPFQWGVTPADEAASDASLMNSIAWDYAQVMNQTFYQSNKPILMAETGWATAGTGKWADYYCYSQNIPCEPSVTNAADYLQDVYSYVSHLSNLSGALIFEAYDEPAKSPTHPDNAENHYGLFDTDCILKDQNTRLLPNTGFDPDTHLGCQGYTKGTSFSIAGTQPNAATNQPPFSVEIQQTNPETTLSANMTVNVPYKDRTDTNVNPWPYFLIFDGAQVKITGNTSGASCSFTAQVQAGAITWNTPTCSNPNNYLVSCNGNNCYLPWNNF